MIQFTLTDNKMIWLARHHIVSLKPNGGTLTVIRMSNGDQWIVRAAVENIVSGWDVKR